MILSISHDFECPPMFLDDEYNLVPHFPNLSYRTPESPGSWENENLSNLQGAKHCCEAIHEMLVDMRWLTEEFERYYVNQDSTGTTESIRSKIAFTDHAAALCARLSSRTPQPENPYYEVVRLVSLIYATALQHCISFYAASILLGSDVTEQIGDHFMKTKLNTCWYGGMAGVVFWCGLVASAAATPLKSHRGRRAARWLRVGAFYCMILLSTEHSDVFLTTTKRLIKVQRVLRRGDCTSGHG